MADGSGEPGLVRRRMSRRSVVWTAAGLSSRLKVEGSTPGADCQGALKEWLAIRQQERGLAAHWSLIECRLMAQGVGATLPGDEQNTLPAAIELQEVEQELDRLEQKRNLCLEQLAEQPARTVPALHIKLCVALDIASEADQPVLHQLLVGLCNDLEAILRGQRFPSP